MSTEYTEDDARAAQPPYKARYTNTLHDPAKCCATVTTYQGLASYHKQCTRKPKVFYGELGYCGQHDPVAAKQKRDKKYADWKAQSRLIAERHTQKQNLDALKTEALTALKEIAAGHNDPRTLALDILAKYGEAPL